MFETIQWSRKLGTKKVRFEIGIFSSSEVHTKCGILINFVCNTFSEWCRKCEKMMDIDGSWKCLVLFQKGWKWLNSLTEGMYFFLPASILSFKSLASQNLFSKNSMHAFFIRPQNFGTNFEFQKKLLTESWPNSNSEWMKVFLRHWERQKEYNLHIHGRNFVWIQNQISNIILVRYDSWKWY